MPSFETVRNMFLAASVSVIVAQRVGAVRAVTGPGA